MRSSSKDAQVEGPQELPLQNGWANNAGQTPFGVYKDRGRVYLQGRIDGTAASAVQFAILPPGYRPRYSKDPIPVLGYAAAGNASGMFELQITPGGNLSLFTSAGAGAGGNANTKFMDLEGISFRASL